MKKKDIIQFGFRGALFGGLGSIIVGFILWIVSLLIVYLHQLKELTMK